MHHNMRSTSLFALKQFPINYLNLFIYKKSFGLFTKKVLVYFQKMIWFNFISIQFLSLGNLFLLIIIKKKLLNGVLLKKIQFDFIYKNFLLFNFSIKGMNFYNFVYKIIFIYIYLRKVTYMNYLEKCFWYINLSTKDISIQFCLQEIDFYYFFLLNKTFTILLTTTLKFNFISKNGF